MIRRRGLFGLGAALAAPLVVPYSRIMPVKAWAPPPEPLWLPAIAAHAVAILDESGRVLATLDAAFDPVRLDDGLATFTGRAAGRVVAAGLAERFTLTDRQGRQLFFGSLDRRRFVTNGDSLLVTDLRVSIS